MVWLLDTNLQIAELAQLRRCPSSVVSRRRRQLSLSSVVVAAVAVVVRRLSFVVGVSGRHLNPENMNTTNAKKKERNVISIH